MTYRHIRVEDRGNVLVVYCVLAELVSDMQVEEVARELYNLCAAEEIQDKKRMILNFEAVRSMSSAMLGKLITLNKRLKMRGIAFRMCNFQPDVAELFTLTNLTQIISPDRDAAPPDFTRFARELYGTRLDVLDRLKEEGFEWKSDFESVDVRHDVYGIDVCGITSEDDAHVILALLIEMFPTWDSCRRVVKGSGKPGWRVEVHRGYGPKGTSA